MKIKRCGSPPPDKGPAGYFTGTVRIDPLSDASNPARRERWERYLRAWSPNRIANTSAWSDAHRDIRCRPCAALGWSARGNPARRCHLDSSGRKALALSEPDRCNDAYCHSGGARRKDSAVTAQSTIRKWPPLREPEPRSERVKSQSLQVQAANRSHNCGVLLCQSRLTESAGCRNALASVASLDRQTSFGSHPNNPSETPNRASRSRHHRK